MAERSRGGAGLRVPYKAARADTRATNRRLVLQHLFGGDPISRAELARVTDLTPATISALVAEIQRDGLVEEVGPLRDDNKVGKPPTMFQIRADARHVVALDLSDPEILRAAVVDLTGDMVSRSEVAAITTSGDAALEQVLELTARAVDQAERPILGIGVGTPGVVSPDGVVVEAAIFGWRDLELRHLIESRFGYPTHVCNDTNAAAIAEYSRGGHDYTNLAVVKIGSGVGAGFVLNGQPYAGQHFGAGEIGHLVVDAEGPLCRCGHRGCLETYVSLPIIVASGSTAAGTEAARRAAAEKLGIALGAVVAILDLDHILVAGPRSVLGEEFCGVAAASLRTRCLQNVADSVSVRFTSLGHDIVLLGAAGVVVSQELGVA